MEQAQRPGDGAGGSGADQELVLALRGEGDEGVGGVDADAEAGFSVRGSELRGFAAFGSIRAVEEIGELGVGGVLGRKYDACRLSISGI